jgi:protease-4
LLPPTIFWNVLGLRAEVQFLRDALAKWGIEIEATAVSPYKSAPDTFVRNDFSPESREQYEHLLDLRYAELLRALAEGRGKSSEQIRELIDHAPLSARAALDAGLVDGLCYEDELEAWLKDGERDPIILERVPALKTLQRPLRQFRKQVVGLVRIEGTIMRGASRTSPLPLPLIGGTMAGAESVAQAMRQAERNPNIAAVLVYVDSGGGEVFASDLMWREVLRVRKQKPVVVVMGNAAASGGYYLATHASAIFAQPATLTGSIGVFILRPVVAGLLEQADIHTTIISRGANSGLLGGTQPPTEAEQAATRDLVFALYSDFTARVCEGRTLTQEQLAPIAGGRVWLGEEAQQHGLVDRIGGIPEALLLAQELAKLPLDQFAPLAALQGGRSDLAPAPFPIDKPQELARMMADLLRPTAWALLPFEIRSTL